jgi:hypothetical protein
MIEIGEEEQEEGREKLIQPQSPSSTRDCEVSLENFLAILPCSLRLGLGQKGFLTVGCRVYSSSSDRNSSCGVTPKHHGGGDEAELWGKSLPGWRCVVVFCLWMCCCTLVIHALGGMFSQPELASKTNEREQEL